MAITHHPDISMLMSCSAGSQPEVFAAIMASHISMCPKCAREVSRMEKIGAALFDQLPPTAVAKPAPVVAARAAEADHGPTTSAPPKADPDVPFPLVDTLGITSLDRIPWKWLAPGVWHYRMPLSPGAKGDLRLLKVAPGVAIPEHGHGGEELTLLLRGSYSDEHGRYHTGDVSDMDPSVEHAPVADPKEGCICLVAVEKQARFKSFLPRILQPWTGL